LLYRAFARLICPQIESLSDVTKAYSPMSAAQINEADETVPPLAKVSSPSTVQLVVHLDTARPLSEPKWAKTGDVLEWLKSMFGRMFWVAGDAAEGWEKKIHVVDPDPVSLYIDGFALDSLFSSRRPFTPYWKVGRPTRHAGLPLNDNDS